MRELELQLYKTMCKIRFFEEKICSVYSKQDMRTPVHLCIGQEAIASGVCANLRDDDILFSTHRGHGHYIAKGGDLLKLVLELYGKKAGCSGGRGGSMHLCDPQKGMPGFSAIVSGVVPVAVGYAFAIKYKNEKRISCVFFGDGAVDEGTLYESFNLAALKRLPVLFICENNFYATSSHIRNRYAVFNLPDKAKSFGVPGYRKDGNDVLEIYNLSRDLIGKIRNTLN
ncbi:MAG: thiamine pyrophosphate-dependent dehydrogenase E1 component subunit alpha [Candidatus Hydrogenedentota bacterium]